MPFFIIFVIIPILEIAVFMTVGEHIGLFTTLLLALLTAIIGGAIVRHQGLQTIITIREVMQEGKIPLHELFDGLCLVAAGATLITPGFITDIIGFLLLVPAFRDLLRTLIKNHTDWAIQTSDFRTTKFDDPNIIEGEYESFDEDKE